MSTDLSNVEVFNITTLKLFAKLYDEFPVPVNIDAKEIGAAASEATESINDTMKMIYYAEHTISWLAEEGFLRFEKAGGPHTTFTNVRLTLKGLTILGYTPSSIQAPEKAQSIIGRVKSVLASGAEKAATEAVKSVLAEIFRLATSPATGQAIGNVLTA